MRKRIIGVLLVLIFFASAICVSAVAAADTTQIKFGEVYGKAGERVEVPVIITGNPGIAGFRFWVEYDMEALTLVSVEKGETFTSGTLKYNVDSEDTTITWFALTDVTGNGELMTLTFDVSENATGNYPLTVAYDPEDIVNASWQQVDCTVTDGKIIVEDLKGLQYAVENNQVTITGYTGNGGDLIVPKTIEGLPVTSIGNYAFHDCTNLISITIPDSVTSIGRGAFSDCIGLTSITIPDSVTRIVMETFQNCTGLTHIVIPDSVICIQEQAFQNCTGLVSIIIPNSVTEIGSIAFENCSSLTCVVIPNSVTWIGEGTFDDCTSLTSVIYCGTQEQWDSIDNSSANSSLFNRTLQFHNIENGVCTICGYKMPYTVTFKNWDDTVISTQTYYWGDDVTAPANPTRPDDSAYTYTFAGWDKDVTTCTGDAVYTAQYQAVAKLNGWVLDGVWYYYINDVKQTNWQLIDDTWYYFASNGAMVTGWQLIDNVWYYFADGGAMQTGWQNLGGTWYYFNASGAMQTGWLLDGGTWYYLNAGGNMATDWQLIGNTWYYFGGSGAMATDWQYIGGIWYYFDGSGAMATGWQLIGGTWYYFGSSGAMATGWQLIGGTWYYFHGSGAMATGWQLIGGTWYYFHAGGNMATGWLDLGGTWYYLYSSGAMAANTYIDGYWINASGVWLG